MRNKRGERERRAVREGERTGRQWDQESSALIIIHDGGCWRHLLIIIHFRSPLMSFVTVHGALLSVIHLYLSRIVELFCVAGLHLALGEVESAGCQTILGCQRWWCHISCMCASRHVLGWSCVVFVSAGRRLGLLCASHIFVAIVGWSRSFVG